MKRICLICIITVFTLLTLACQIPTFFVIVNSSDSQLEVYYELKPSGMMPNKGVRNPKIISVEEFNGGKFQWRELPSNKFAVDTEKGIVKALIEPNEVLQIESEDIYWVDKEPSEYFDIKKLVLNGVNGSVTYQGNQIYKQFKREEKGWFKLGGTVFVIYYK